MFHVEHCAHFRFRYEPPRTIRSVPNHRYNSDHARQTEKRTVQRFSTSHHAQQRIFSRTTPFFSKRKKHLAVRCQYATLFCTGMIVPRGTLPLPRMWHAKRLGKDARNGRDKQIRTPAIG